MNNAQLEYFVEVMRTGSYRAAATHLYVSPQAISQSIKTLENELGIQLMSKRGRTVVPTPDALRLFPDAERLISEFSSFESKARRVASKQPKRQVIRLGITEAPLRGCLYEKKLLKSRAETLQPGVQIRFLPNEPCKDTLREGLLDAAVIQGNLRHEQSICSKFLAASPLCLFTSSRIIPKDFTLEMLNGAHVAVPTDTHMCFSYVRNLLVAHNVHPTFDLIDSDENSLRNYLCNGGYAFGYGISPIETWPGIVKLCLNTSNSQILNFYLCWTTSKVLDSKLYDRLKDWLPPTVSQ